MRCLLARSIMVVHIESVGRREKRKKREEQLLLLLLPFLCHCFSFGLLLLYCNRGIAVFLLCRLLNYYFLSLSFGPLTKYLSNSFPHLLFYSLCVASYTFDPLRAFFLYFFQAAHTRHIQLIKLLCIINNGSLLFSFAYFLCLCVPVSLFLHLPVLCLLPAVVLLL